MSRRVASIRRVPKALRTVATDPYCIPGISDGGAHTKFITTGTYPTDFLIDLVRGRGNDGPRRRRTGT